MAKKTEESRRTELEPVESTKLMEYEYSQDDLGAGYENQTKADTQVPFLVLLQALSPIVVDALRQDAKAGAWLNTVTQEIYDKQNGFLFIPATTKHYFAEWIPRDQGGGFRGHHEIDSDVVKKALQESTRFGKNKTDQGNDLVETFYVYGIVCREDATPDSMGVIAFSSTKIRSYKGWMTRLRQCMIHTPTRRIRPPLYAHMTRINSSTMKNEKGQFFVPNIVAAGGAILKSLLQPTDEAFQMAKACRELVESGDARIDPDQQNSQGSDTEAGSVPF